MKTIRQISGLLLIVNGMLHVFEYVNLSDSSIGILVFGIIYLITGILLFNKKLYPLYLGVFIPLIGMTLSLIKFGIPELLSLSALFKLFGIIVVFCCVYILFNYKKSES